MPNTTPAYPPVAGALFRALAVAAALAAASPGRSSVWVSPSGDDRNPGSDERPVRTLACALDRARTEAGGAAMADDATVFVGDGLFRLDQPLVIGPAEGGANGYSLILAAAPGARPVIRGSVRVSGWRLADPRRNLWTAPAPAAVRHPQQLWVDGRRAERVRARLQMNLTPVEAGYHTSDPGAGAALGAAGVDFVYLAGPALWSEPAGTRQAGRQFRCPVAEAASAEADPSEAGVIRMSPAVWHRIRDGVGPRPTWVENFPGSLGEPGRWQFDAANRILSYVPRSGEDPSRADIELPAVSDLVVIAGEPGRPVSGVVLKGLRLEGAAESALRADRAGDIQLLEDVFTHAGGPAVALGPQTRSCVVEGCAFLDTGGDALRLGGEDTRVANNLFHHPGAVDFSGVAVRLDGARNCLVRHNEADDAPGPWLAGPSSGRAPAGTPDNRIGDNRVVRCGSLFGNPPDAASSAQAAGGRPGPEDAFRFVFSERPPACPPEPPPRIEAVAGDEWALASWDPSPFDGGSPITGYEVLASDGRRTEISAAGYAETGYIRLDGIPDGTPVRFRVRALNACGAGPLSIESAAVLPARTRRPRAPSAPAAARMRLGAGAVTVAWKAPRSDGGSPVVGYEVTLRSAGDDEDVRRFQVGGRDVLTLGPGGVGGREAEGSGMITRTFPWTSEAAPGVTVAAVTAAGETGRAVRPRVGGGW